MLVSNFLMLRGYQFHFNLLFRLSNPNISEWMRNMNISDAVGIHTYYANRILDIMSDIKSTPIVWQDVWDEKVQVRL